MRVRRSRARAVVVAAALAGTVLGSSCGPPGDGAARRVDDDTVPYRLLEPSDEGERATSPAPASDPAPFVFWVSDDDRLVTTPVDASCTDDPGETVEALLDALTAGPGEEDRVRGRSSALPPESALDLVGLDDGTAEVTVATATGVSADRLPIAVGQVVLTVASAPGVRSVVLTNDGEPVPVPLPGGALTADPVRAVDYASLVPPFLREVAVTGCADD